MCVLVEKFLGEVGYWVDVCVYDCVLFVVSGLRGRLVDGMWCVLF